MEFSAAQIAMIVNGRIEGDPGITVSSFGKIEEAKADQLAFLSNPKYEEYLYTTRAAILLVSESLALKKGISATLIRVKDPYTAFATLLAKYQEMMNETGSGIQEPSYISKSALIGEKVFIGAFVYVGEQVRIGAGTSIMPGAYIGNNVTIGDHTTIYPGVKIYQGCVIGNNVIIHGGTIVGSDGFGFAPQADGSFKKVPQIGNVVIEDDVEIGSNTTIDRATIGSTFIRKGAKLDNLIQVAHNVEIGESTVIAAQAGISGSTHIGKQVMIGGQAGIVGHIRIGDGAKINAQSGVSKTLEAGKAVTGSPAYDYTSSLRSQAIARRLPELEARIKELEAIIKKLAPQASSNP